MAAIDTFVQPSINGSRRVFVPNPNSGDERTALVGGPYVAPVVGLGEWLTDAIHGPVEVGGYSSGPIPWPRRLKTGRRVLILCGDLVQAVRTESALAIAHHFGVGSVTVSKWRVALGVDRQNNEGTVTLYKRMNGASTAPASDRRRAEVNSTPDEPREIETSLALPRPVPGAAMSAAERKKKLRDRKIARGERRTSVDLSDEARDRADRSAKAAGVSRTQWINDLILGASQDSLAEGSGGPSAPV